ncbi:DNA recombination protein RmuC [Patescibacteria group bacterium]|nr:DNA recombination protein RmuC [Patescibacteria group bacterium]
MNTTLIYVFIIVFLVLVNGVFLWFIYNLVKKGQENKNEGQNENAFSLLQNQMNELNKTLDSKIGESSKLMSESVKTQFGESQKLMNDIANNSQKIIKDVTEKMTEIKETNKQVFGMTEQLQNLEKVLKNQKQRGSLGEAGLDLILSNILPPTAYQMQYSFADGDIVDAIIHTKDGIIPVDAKFSLDNYNRVINEEDENQKLILEKEFQKDLKKRIDETSKYIKIKEGTLPFAIMYIPAEAIYYDLLVNEVGSIKINTKSLIEYAYRDRKVIIVSPTTFVAYLSTILQGFKAFKVEESAKEIIKNVEKLQAHIKAYDSYHTKLGTSLATTVNHFNTSRKELGKIDKDVYRITGGSAEIEPILVGKPDKEE